MRFLKSNLPAARKNIGEIDINCCKINLTGFIPDKNQLSFTGKLKNNLNTERRN
jgi:hypothetical protein